MSLKNRKTMVLFILLMTTLLFSACTSTTPIESRGGKEKSIEEGNRESFEIIGLGDTEMEIYVDKLREFKGITKDVVAVNSAGKENAFQVTGMLFDDLLGGLGYAQKDLPGIRLIAGDGYSIDLPKEIIDHRDIILAYDVDGEPLKDENKPIRVIIPEERAMYWVRNVIKIEITKSIEQSAAKKIVFLGTAASILEQEDYDYYDHVDKAIKVKDLISAFAEGVEGDMIIKATDGLEKTESKDVFESAYIKTSGNDAPGFMAPDMPKGMHVKNILWMIKGDIAFFSQEMGETVLTPVEIDDRKGTPIKDVMEQMGMKQSDKYLLKAVDNFTLEISRGEIEKGILYFGDKGELRTYFDGLPKNTSMKGLLSIEVME